QLPDRLRPARRGVAGRRLPSGVGHQETGKGAPHADADGRTGPEDEAELYRYYEDLYRMRSRPSPRDTGHDTSGP
ncbi:MAG: hypothetical protein ACLGHS_14795, partial [Actinomycetes bacterium]